MCEYCNLVTTGGDFEYIGVSPLDFGILGDFELTSYVTTKDTDAEEGTSMLALNIDAADCTGVIDKTYYLPIHYCPMCGADLRRKKGELK